VSQGEIDKKTRPKMSLRPTANTMFKEKTEYFLKTEKIIII
jgi:hypothetical protein